MVKLARREEQILQVFWEVGKAFIRDIIPLLPEAKPHLATMVKILEEKGFLSHESIGNMFECFPLIQKEDYQNSALKDVVSQYFICERLGFIHNNHRRKKLNVQRIFKSFGQQTCRLCWIDISYDNTRPSINFMHHAGTMGID